MAELPYLPSEYLVSTPFDGILTVSVDDIHILHPAIQTHLNKELQKRNDYGICAHDSAHINRSISNGLVLWNMLQSNLTEITPTDIAFTLFTHDLGYGSENIKIHQQHADGHEQESLNIVNTLTHDLPDRHASRQYITSHYDLIRSGILGTAGSHDQIIQTALAKPTPNNIFALLISAADKADYFVRDRVAHLLPPDDMTNPYHSLAYAVNAYQLQFDETNKTLTYAVKLHGQTSFENNKQAWQTYARENFPQVFKLLEAVTSLAGYTFVVEVL